MCAVQLDGIRRSASLTGMQKLLSVVSLTLLLAVPSCGEEVEQKKGELRWEEWKARTLALPSNQQILRWPFLL